MKNNGPISEKLFDSLKAHNALPYLFIGSGISRRYFGLPDWSGLLSYFADKTEKPFAYYLSKSDGDYPKAASMIADNFFDIWWEDDSYQDQRSYFQDIPKSREDPFKIAVAEYIKNWNSSLWIGNQPNKELLREEMASARKSVIDGIITTNFDNFTDIYFKSFKEYVGQDEILLSDAQFIAETFKIHGSANKFQSLILTNNDYDNYLNRNHYLTAKLLTIFAEHPVIFLGYSIKDEYIGQILNNIANAVGPDRLDDLGKRIYFVEWNEDPTSTPQIEQTSQGRGSSQLPMTKIETNSFTWIWDTLGRLERPFPAILLRELKQHIFQLINNPEPNQAIESVKAIPIDSEDAQGLKVVFGVAALSETDLEDISSLSARTLEREDLLEDILGLRKRPLDPENVLLYGISRGIRANKNHYIPIYKYLHETGRLRKDNIDFSNLPEIIEVLSRKEISISDSSRKKFEELTHQSNMMIEDLNLSEFLPYLKAEIITAAIQENKFKDIEKVRQIVINLFNESKNQKINNLPKLICALDKKLYFSG